MKKILALILAGVMLLALVACGGNETAGSTDDANATGEVANGGAEDGEKTVGQILLADFKALSSKSAQEIADGILQNSILEFMGMAMPVEEGLLNGFDNTEIKGFKEGVMFGPAIGSIPFIGYVFVLEDGADVNAFKKTLDDAANLRWNICVTADEKIVENEGNTVFFLMCPASFEQEGTAGDDLGGMDLAPEDQLPAEDGDVGVEDDLNTPAAEGEEGSDEVVDTPAVDADQTPAVGETDLEDGGADQTPAVGETDLEEGGAEENPAIEDDEEVA